MDAVKFLEESVRMCKSFPGCEGCEMKENEIGFPCNTTSGSMEYENYEKLVEIVEKWAKDHPKKTRQSEFLKRYPDAAMTEDKFINISPCIIDTKNYNYKNDTCEKFEECIECARQYWMGEIE